MRALPLILALALPTGCWIGEEMDSGMEILEQHSPKDRREKQAEPERPPAPEAARPAREGPGLFGSLIDWVGKKFEPPPPPPDPSDEIVRCIFRGREQFLRLYDCELRGGRPVALPADSS